MGVLRGVWDGVERDERGEKGMILRKREGGFVGRFGGDLGED